LLKDGTQERVMVWCGDDQSLRAETADAAPGSRFSIRVRTAMGECQVNSPEYGVERIVVERKITLTAEQQKILTEAGFEREETLNRALRGLISSRSSLISCSLDQIGGQTTISMSHPVYVDGLTRHSFLSALTDVDRFTTVIDLWMTSLKSVARMRRKTEDAINKSRMELEEAAPPPPVKSVPPPPPVHPASPGTRTCAKCGSILNQGYRFCKRCGTPASGEVMPR
jgi:hypothetical protein